MSAAAAIPLRQGKQLSTEELARLYFDEGLSLAKVGNKVGLPPTTVHYRLKCAGYKLRPRSVPTIPTAKLIRLYEGGLSCAKVGKQVGLSSPSVYSRLKLAGCKMRPRKENTVGVPTEKLRRLYFDERLKLSEVGAIVGLNFASVASRLRRAGYTLRTSAPPKKEVPSIASLIDDYVNRISVATLAERTGLKPSLIWSRLRDAGVVRPRGHNAKEIWAKRNKQQAEGEARVTAAQADVERLTQELAQAKTELAKAKAAKAEVRRKSYTPEDITLAIQFVRKMPSVQHRTGMQALNISETEFYRWLKQGKLKKYKKGFVYSAQILQILDRGLAERKQ